MYATGRERREHGKPCVTGVTIIFCQTSPFFNALSPSIHIQILQTDLHTFPLRISWENLIKHQGIFSFMIIFYILTTLSLDNVWTLLGENCCCSLLGLKGLNRSFCKRPEKINGKWRSWQNSQVITLSRLSHIRVLPSSLSCHLVVWTYYYGPGEGIFSEYCEHDPQLLL